MESILIQRPPRTIREVFDALPEETLAQLIDNQLVISPAQTYNHQKVLQTISFAIQLYLNGHNLGEILIAPFDVYLDEENIFQPDLILIRTKNQSKIQQNGCHGAPDLVLEVLSPGTKRHDKGKKKSAYERHGVPEYWLVDPDTKEAEGFFLKDGKYGEPLQSTGKIESEVLDHTFEF